MTRIRWIGTTGTRCVRTSLTTNTSARNMAGSYRPTRTRPSIGVRSVRRHETPCCGRWGWTRIIRNALTGSDVCVLGPGETMAVSRAGELILEDGTRLQVHRQTPPDLPIGYHRFQPRRRGGMRLDHQAAEQLLDAARAAGLGLGGATVRSPLACQLGHGRSGRFATAGALVAATWRGRAHAQPSVRRRARACRSKQVPTTPASRRFRNPLYLRIEEIPGAQDASVDLSNLAAAARQLNDRRRIDRDAVFRLKMEALERIWGLHPADLAFDRY